MVRMLSYARYLARSQHLYRSLIFEFISAYLPKRPTMSPREAASQWDVPAASKRPRPNDPATTVTCKRVWWKVMLA
jgi:hypothetical protein